MKFYPQHQQDLNAAISQYGFEKTDFSFTKKRGRIIIVANNTSKTFSYIEMKESKLDVSTMKSVETSLFEIAIDGGKKEEVPSWEIVMLHFKAWLTVE